MRDAEADWGASGLAHLTGMPSGAPDFSRAAVLVCARAATVELRDGLGVDVDAAQLLAGRAGLLGLSRGGRTSAGGATRLMAARDGWCALTLSRPDDVETVPALVEALEAQQDPWPAVERWVKEHDAAEVTERARLLGLPAAELGESSAAMPVVRRTGRTAEPRSPKGLLVVDLSSMWAGPLCGQLFVRAGATVVKVESPSRPDGTRAGSQAFFDWMNTGKLCYAVEFTDHRLRALLSAADVVIESSRPTALRRRGLGPDGVSGRDGRVWLQLTGHGSDGIHGDWVAFGDDAAVAGGLVGRGTAGPVFCADAIADPLTGLHAALAVSESLARGGGELIGVAMASVAARYGALPQHSAEGALPAARPRPPEPSPPASELGADNADVDHLIAERGLTPC